MAKKIRPTIKEIEAFLKKEGFHEVTEEEKKTDWYKQAIKKPSCFKSKMVHKRAV